MTFRRRYFLPLAVLSLAASIITAVWVIVFWHDLTPAEEALFEHLLLNRFAQILVVAFLILSALAFCLGALLHYYLIPLRRLTEETMIISTANPSHRIRLKGARSILNLVDVINRSADRFEEMNRRIRAIIRLGKQRAETEKAILAEVLAQVSEAVVVCNNAGKILLYNEKARRLLSAGSNTDEADAPPDNPLGLNRSIYRWLDREKMERRIRSLSQSVEGPAGPSEHSFVARLPDGRNISMRISPVLDSTLRRMGFVLIPTDDERSQIQALPPDPFVAHGPNPSMEEDRRIPYPLRSNLQAPEAAFRVVGGPVVWDFNLFSHGDEPGYGHRSLKSLSYTVFDTETSGLFPLDGDEIISIGAVRATGERLLPGETFDQLVDPRGPLRPQSMHIHGIRPEMLKGRPGIEKVLPAFHRFAQDSVLVGHNAAFDMRFIGLKEKVAGVTFRNPLLDTLLLSAVVLPHQETHGLEALADRLGIEKTGRHTALDDALTTAKIFLKLIPLLEEKGIIILKQALKASKETPYARIRY